MIKKTTSLRRALFHISNSENDTSNEAHMKKLWLVKFWSKPGKMGVPRGHRRVTRGTSDNTG
jgi:hypothetical protein